jgi:2-polyprenyl-3-methyl-5-hydroxy-6-metoxy-1,4-benzoquinol methylase
VTVIPEVAQEDGRRVEEFAGGLFGAGLAALELLNVELGLRLGLYERLVEHGPSMPAELAEAAGIGERYAREWLEQQAVAGVVEVDNPGAAPAARRFSLPAAHAEVLLDTDSEAYLAPLAKFVPVAARALEAVAEAFRSGRGVPYSDYGVHDLQAAFTRPVFVNHLTRSWLPALTGVYPKLQAGTARVAEIGCGEGLAAVQIARDFPGVTVDGFDADDASIAAARKHAADAGVGDRVRFEVRDATRLGRGEPYDLVLCIETLHDVADPVGVLRAMRALRAPGGAVLVADERTAEEFTTEAGEMERLFYACSTLHCLPVGLAEEGSAGTGAVMRPSTLRRYASKAGFSGVDIVPVEHPQFRLYLLEG